MKAFLVGLAGSGKTTLGKQLAVVSGVPFLDLDSVIEEVEGMAVAQVFALRGETYFREVEAALLRKTTQQHEHFVLSTGGGAPCFLGNMDFIVKNGLAIYLDVPAAILRDRVIADGIAHRPLYDGLTNADILSKIEEQHKARHQFYQQAQITLSGDHLTIQELLTPLKNMPK